MAGKIKLYFDIYENTFTSVSDDFDYDPDTGDGLGKAIETFYMGKLKEAMQLGITDPDNLSLSVMSFDENRVRQTVDGFPEKLLKAIGKFHSIHNLEITYFNLNGLDLDLLFMPLFSIKHVNLSNTHIDSIRLPEHIYPSLETLALENNQLTTLPTEMSECKSLQTLVLKNNPFETSNPMLKQLLEDSNTHNDAQQILREFFEESSTEITYTKYHDRLLKECIKPIKEYLLEEQQHSDTTPNIEMGIKLSKFPHEFNLNSSYYRHIYLSFMLYYRIYFESDENVDIRVDEKNLFGALSNAKYEFQSRHKKGPLTLVEQYEIFFYWMYVAKPFHFSSKLKTATTEVLTIIHIFTVCKILEDINTLPSTPNILKRETILKLRGIINVRPSDPFSIHDTVQVESLRSNIRDLIEDLIPNEIKEHYTEYAENDIKEQVDKQFVDLTQKK